NWPKGPLEYADELGIDTIVKALEEWVNMGLGGFAPDPLLLQMVKGGKLGRKTGEGFYKYAGSVVAAVTETLEKMYGESLKQLDMLISSTGLPVYRDPRSGALLWVDVREMRLRFTLSVNKLEKFVEGLQQGKLLYTQCRKCGAKYFPPQVDCPRCKASDVEWREVSGVGELITWTVINVKPASFSHHKDYVVGIVKMPDGFNITAWVDADPKILKPGMKMRLVVDRRPGENYITYWFKPA
ncbi:OB-fold domain-containing protein, partial [Pyrobaculum sp.]|uniref:Zn-ribbon domain-containing OB-fold protein n=1 Tax=Pyrobaculum sp. TaxID=2004705 RepID=UPI003D0F0F48